MLRNVFPHPRTGFSLQPEMSSIDEKRADGAELPAFEASSKAGCRFKKRLKKRLRRERRLQMNPFRRLFFLSSEFSNKIFQSSELFPEISFYFSVHSVISPLRSSLSILTAVSKSSVWPSTHIILTRAVSGRVSSPSIAPAFNISRPVS